MRKLNCHSLLSRLNSLCKFLDTAYAVNSGGCCYLSYVIAQQLDKLGIKYSLVVQDNRIRNIDEVEKEVITCRKNKGLYNSIIGNHCCSHYCIHLEGAGTINSLEADYTYNISGITYKNIKWLYKKGDWNTCYDVQHNKTIKNIVKEFFREYE